MNEEKRRDKVKFMTAGFNSKDIDPERRKKLEAECFKCQERFQAINFDGRTFDYSRCSKCNTGRILHEMDAPGWFADYVKSGL